MIEFLLPVETPWVANRAIAFFKMKIGWHGLGVLAMAVSLTDSHGLPQDGHTVIGLAVRRESPVSKQHNHVEDSMIVAPLYRSLNQ